MKKIWQIIIAAGAVISFSEIKLATARGPTDLTHVHPGALAPPPIGWIQFCKQYPKDCAAPKLLKGFPSATKAKLLELDRVNRYFNQSIVAITDLEQYGVVEYWTYPVTGKGDCEEYVLEKRRALIQLGWPPESLLVTVVLDKQRGGHAVLTVTTNQEDLVLDNVTDEILPWSESGLTFIKRQSPTDPNMWVDLGRTLGVPEVITAATRR